MVSETSTYHQEPSLACTSVPKCASTPQHTLLSAVGELTGAVKSSTWTKMKVKRNEFKTQLRDITSRMSSLPSLIFSVAPTTN